VVIAVSAVPPLVAAHTLHLTAAAGRPTPRVTAGGTEQPVRHLPVKDEPNPVVPAEVVSAALEARQDTVTLPLSSHPKSPENSRQRTRSEQVLRALYDSLGGMRPGTSHIRDALRDAGLPSSDGSCPETKKRVAQREPQLKKLSPAPAS
jgi:hypothetical protein